MLIRPARREDAALAASLIYEVLPADVAAKLLGRLDRDRALAIASQLVASRWGRWSHRQIWVAEVGGEPAGIFLGFPGTDGGWLDLGFAWNLTRLTGWQAIGRLARFEWALWRSGSVEFTAAEFYIDSLAVLPQFRGQGIGSALLTAAERQAEAHGLGRCSLFVTQINPRAKQLYERMGYQVVARYDFPYTVFRMVKILRTETAA